MAALTKVLFVNPPTIPLEHVLDADRRRDAPFALPLAIPYLSAYVKAAGVVAEVGLLDYHARMVHELERWSSLTDFLDGVARSAVSFTPDVIAISCIFSTSWDFCSAAATTLKNFWPRAVVLLGGTHVTSAVRKTLAHPDVDFVVRGEGELALADVLRRVGAGQEVNVTGVYGRAKLAEQGGHPELAAYATQLDDLAHPDFDLFDVNFYVDHNRAVATRFEDAQPKRMAPLMTSRGCPFHCTFCASHSVHGRRLRYHSIPWVIEEIRRLNERYGITLFMPEDDLFVANKARVLSLLRAIQDLPLREREIQLPSALSVNALDEEIIDALYAAGTRIFILAIESGSEYVQRHVIKKRCNLKRAPELVRAIREKGAYCRCYFILGFPGETPEQMRETIRYAHGLSADWCHFAVATPLIGSEMYDQFRSLLGSDARIPADIVRERSFDTPEITAEQINDLQAEANLEVNYFGNANLREGRLGARQD